MHVDVGLFAEALIYYERIAITLGTPGQFAELLARLKKDDALDVFLGLVRDGTISIYDYAFFTAPVSEGPDSTKFSLWNWQDEIMERPDTWEMRTLYNADVERLLPSKARKRTKVYEAFRGHVIEVKASGFGPALENAREDFANPERAALLMQAYLDDLFSLRNLADAPNVRTQISCNGGETKIHWNIDFNEISRISGPRLGFRHGIPFTGGAISNRLLWSAAQLSCDIVVASPLATLVGNKLAETERRLAVQDCIESLEERVEFPDIRSLVNDGQLSFVEVVRIRKHALRFRKWLQEEGDRDRDAIIAYHHEVAEESGITAGARKVLSLFGVLGGGAIGAYLGADQGALGSAIGGAAGSGATYLADLVAKFGEGWRPVVFGRWLKSHIRSHLDRRVR
jgi:hypothetical protein